MAVRLDACELRARIRQIPHPARLDAVVPDETRGVDRFEEHLTGLQLCQTLERAGVIDDQCLRLRHVERLQQCCKLRLTGELTHDFRGRSAAGKSCAELWR